ncbi:MAG: hypothetical protein ACRCU5_09500 [Rhizobiaceae bacterium]
MARRLLSNALAQGKTDAECKDFAIAAMGSDSRGLVDRVWQRYFEIFGGAG